VIVDGIGIKVVASLYADRLLYQQTLNTFETKDQDVHAQHLTFVASSTFTRKLSKLNA